MQHNSDNLDSLHRRGGVPWTRLGAKKQGLQPGKDWLMSWLKLLQKPASPGQRRCGCQQPQLQVSAARSSLLRRGKPRAAYPGQGGHPPASCQWQRKGLPVHLMRQLMLGGAVLDCCWAAGSQTILPVDCPCLQKHSNSAEWWEVQTAHWTHPKN